MPNWAFTDYVVTGDKKQVEKLYNTMRELEEMNESLCENGFGKRWLGNLVEKLGGDWNKIHCRGSWDNLMLNHDGTVFFSTETAWGEMDEVRHFIEKKLPGIKLYYQCEESGMRIYQKNDPSGEYFPDNYYLWIEDGESEYYASLAVLTLDVEKITGIKNLKSFDDCMTALDTYSQENDDMCYTLEKIQIVDD